MIEFVSPTTYLSEDVYVKVELSPITNNCKPYSCAITGYPASYIKVPLPSIKRNGFFTISLNGCDDFNAPRFSTINAPEDAVSYADFIVEKINEIYDEFYAVYDMAENSIVVVTNGCPTEIFFCELDCIVANITHHPQITLTGYDRSCVTCKFKDFETAWYYNHIMTMTSAGVRCPECQDYSSLIEVIPGSAKENTTVTPAKIKFSGKLATSAATNNPPLHLSAIINGETVYLNQEISPDGQRGRTFFLTTGVSGTHTVRLIVGNDVFCVTEIQVPIEEVPCLNDELDLSFDSPNIITIRDDSDCGFGTLRVNYVTLEPTSIVPISGEEDRYYLLTLPQSPYYNFLYTNDCGCFKAITANTGLSERCVGEDLRARVVNYFKVLNEAVKTNFNALGAISIPPLQQDASSTLREFIVNNCVGNCASLAFSVVPSTPNMSAYFRHVFECQQSLTYYRQTKTTEFRSTNIRRIIEDVLKVTVTDFPGTTRFFYTFVGLVVNYANMGFVSGPTMLMNFSAAAVKTLPMNLNTDPIVYSVDQTLQSNPAVVFSFNPPTSQLDIFS